MMFLFQDYAKQFDVQPVSQLEAYCQQEGVSLSSVRKPDKNRDKVKKPGNAGKLLRHIIIKLKAIHKVLLVHSLF